MLVMIVLLVHPSIHRIIHTSIHLYALFMCRKNKLSFVQQRREILSYESLLPPLPQTNGHSDIRFHGSKSWRWPKKLNRDNDGQRQGGCKHETCALFKTNVEMMFGFVIHFAICICRLFVSNKFATVRTSFTGNRRKKKKWLKAIVIAWVISRTSKWDYQ